MQNDPNFRLVMGKIKLRVLANAIIEFVSTSLFKKTVSRKKGINFNLLKFHDRALDVGPLPLKTVESLIL